MKELSACNGDVFPDLAVVENPGFAFGMSKISWVVAEIKLLPVCDGHFAISWLRSCRPVMGMCSPTWVWLKTLD